MPPRPNSSTEEILVTTVQLIAELDVSGVTVDLVAEKTGVSKATIYRRWPSREELIFEAMTYIKYPQAAADTGSIREDLSVLLHDLVHFLNRPDGGRVYAAFLNSALRNPKLAELRGDVSTNARVVYHAAIDKAIARGELRADVNRDVMIEMLIAPFVYRRIGAPMDVPEPLISEVIDLVLAGAAAR